MTIFSRIGRFLRGETGASIAELALITPMFFLILTGSIDFARAYYLSMEVSGAAQAGATYGASHHTDTTGITTAAEGGAFDIPTANLTVTPTYGCECANATIGSTNSSLNCSSTPTCTGSNLVYWEKVTASTTFSPLFPWPGVPSSMTFTQAAVMRSAN